MCKTLAFVDVVINLYRMKSNLYHYSSAHNADRTRNRKKNWVRKGERKSLWKEITRVLHVPNNRVWSTSTTKKMAYYPRSLPQLEPPRRVTIAAHGHLTNGQKSFGRRRPAHLSGPSPFTATEKKTTEYFVVSFDSIRHFPSHSHIM